MIRITLPIVLLLITNCVFAYDFVACPQEDLGIGVEISPIVKYFSAQRPHGSRCKDKDYQADAQASYNTKFKTSKTALATLKQLIGSQELNKYYKKICKKNITCVLEKVYGNREVGQRAMIIKKQYGYTVSYKTPRAKKKVQWKDYEIRDLHRALILIPKHFHRLYYLGVFYKVPKKERLSSVPNAVAWTYTTTRKSKRANTPIYITHRNFTRKDSVRNIIHELAHQVDSAGISKDKEVRRDSSGFSKIAKWKVTKKKSKDTRGNPVIYKEYSHQAGCFITNYAKTNPKEHFAESFAHYIEQPKKLKRKCPKVYDYLKKSFFKNVEYHKFNKNWCSKR